MNTNIVVLCKYIHMYMYTVYINNRKVMDCFHVYPNNLHSHVVSQKKRGFLEGWSPVLWMDSLGIFWMESRMQSLMTLHDVGWCSTLTLLLICSSSSRENCHPLLICSSISTAQLLVGGFSPTNFEKYAPVKLDHDFPKGGRGEKKKCLSCHHPV